MAFDKKFSSEMTKKIVADAMEAISKNPEMMKIAQYAYQELQNRQLAGHSSGELVRGGDSSDSTTSEIENLKDKVKWHEIMAVTTSVLIIMGGLSTIFNSLSIGDLRKRVNRIEQQNQNNMELQA